jgi:hypothetical protein
MNGTYGTKGGDVVIPIVKMDKKNGAFNLPHEPWELWDWAI